MTRNNAFQVAPSLESLQELLRLVVQHEDVVPVRDGGRGKGGGAGCRAHVCECVDMGRRCAWWCITRTWCR